MQLQGSSSDGGPVAPIYFQILIRGAVLMLEYIHHIKYKYIDIL